MKPNHRINAVKMVILALEEVETHNGVLPPGDPEANEEGPRTFLDLVKGYAGERVPESELLVVIEAMAQLLPDYQFPWS
jgi:hypothetical protein